MDGGGGPACLTPTFTSTRVVSLGATGLTDTSPWLSDDERDLLFARVDTGTHHLLLHAHRDDASKGFDMPVPMAVNDGSDNDNPFVGAGEHTLWFDSNRDPTGTRFVYEAGGSFSNDFGPTAARHDELNSVREPASSDGKTIYFAFPAALPKLGFATRPGQVGNFGSPTVLGTVDAEAPSVAADGTTIVFTNQTNNEALLFQATIVARDLVAVTALDVGLPGAHTVDGNLSSDGQTLVFSSDATGTPQIYIGKRVCSQ